MKQLQIERTVLEIEHARSVLVHLLDVAMAVAAADQEVANDPKFWDRLALAQAMISALCWVLGRGCDPDFGKYLHYTETELRKAEAEAHMVHPN